MFSNQKRFCRNFLLAKTMRGKITAIQIAADGSSTHFAILLHTSSRGKVDPAIVLFESLHKPFF